MSKGDKKRPEAKPGAYSNGYDAIKDWNHKSEIEKLEPGTTQLNVSVISGKTYINGVEQSN
jgi:hypothetical protein